MKKLDLETLSLSIGIAIVLAVVGLCATVDGCATRVVPGTTNTVQVLSPVAVSGIQVAATLGCQVALTRDPALKPYLVLGSQAIFALASQGNYDPAALANALKASTGTALNAETSVLIADAVTLYNGVFQEIVAKKLDPNQTAKPALIALATGIQLGISAGPIALIPSVEVKPAH